MTTITSNTLMPWLEKTVSVHYSLADLIRDHFHDVKIELKRFFNRIDEYIKAPDDLLRTVKDPFIIQCRVGHGYPYFKFFIHKEDDTFYLLINITMQSNDSTMQNMINKDKLSIKITKEGNIIFSIQIQDADPYICTDSYKYLLTIESVKNHPFFSFLKTINRAYGALCNTCCTLDNAILYLIGQRNKYHVELKQLESGCGIQVRQTRNMARKNIKRINTELTLLNMGLYGNTII